jgi:hypothetical protein
MAFAGGLAAADEKRDGGGYSIRIHPVGQALRARHVAVIGKAPEMRVEAQPPSWSVRISRPGAKSRFSTIAA